MMTGLPSREQADALVAALHAAVWTADTVQRFSPRESLPELEAMVADAGPMAGFGDETRCCGATST